MRVGKSIVMVFVVVLFMAQTVLAAQPNVKAKNAMLYDVQSDAILINKEANVPVPPSSMSKLMTLYILFDRLKSEVLSLEDTFRVSKKAWSKKGSKMFVAYNSKVKIKDLIRGIIVQSGNDACIVVAEGISGDEVSFSDEMNRMAKEIGLTQSHFVNATGWPDEAHVMSMQDLVTLSQRLIQDFPEYYHYFSETQFTYNNIRQYNRNTLLHEDSSVDGLKTGHTDAGGYGIVVSAERQGRRLILAVNGLDSKKARISEAERLINYGFRHFHNKKLFDKGQFVDKADVWFGKQEDVSLVTDREVVVTVPKRWKANDAEMVVRYQGPIQAPITKGDHIADIVVEAKAMEMTVIPLYAAEDVPALPVWGHMIRSLRYYLMGY